MLKFGKVIHYLKKIEKINELCDTRLSSTDISIFYRKSANFALSENTDVDFQMCIISNSLTFLQFLKVNMVLINMVTT